MPPKPKRFYLCSGEIVKAQELRQYSNSHIVGELRYVEDEDRRVTALAVYEQSLHTDLCLPEHPEVRLDVIGDARNIKCTQCGRTLRWEIGQAGFLALMSHFGISTLEQVESIVKQKGGHHVELVV